jgi:hypothetical protein
MSLAAAFLLAAALAGQASSAEIIGEPNHGAQVETAHVAARILRGAAIVNGELNAKDSVTPRSQRQSRGGRVTYEFE